MGYFDDYDDFDFSYSSSSYSTSSSKNDEAIFIAILGTYFVTVMVLAIVVVIATLVGLWKIFTKAGEEGWKAIIPFYNNYVLFEIVWDVKYFWFFLIGELIAGALLVADIFIPLIPALIALVIYVYLLYITVKLNYNLSRSFGKSGGFAIGLIFLTPIFYLILGFSKNAVYKGNITKNQKGVIQNINSTLV